MPCYRVTDPLRHDGKRYEKGDVVEMTQKQAKQAARYDAVDPKPLRGSAAGEQSGGEGDQAPDDLAQISGISAARADVLREKYSIASLNDLAELGDDVVPAIAAELRGVAEATVNDWRAAAADILGQQT